MESLANYKVKQLQDLCKTLGLRSTGRKADLIQRIVECQTYASEYHFSSESASSKKRKVHQDNINQESIDQAFQTYEDPNSPDEITDEGIFKLCADLKIDPQEPVTLVLSWYMQAENMCIYTRKEFLTGFQSLGCSTIDEMKAKMPQLRSELDNMQIFTNVYNYSFDFGKDPDQKSISIDIAIALWEVLLGPKFNLLKEWLNYIKETNIKVVSKDLWMQILEFSKHIQSDLNNFDEDGAWPVLIDDFVTYLKSRK